MMTYLGRSQPWGCHLQYWYSLSGLPCSWQVNCGCMYGHSDSSYSGRVNSSLTHLPLKISHDPSSVFPTANGTFCRFITLSFFNPPSQQHVHYPIQMRTQHDTTTSNKQKKKKEQEYTEHHEIKI